MGSMRINSGVVTFRVMGARFALVSPRTEVTGKNIEAAAKSKSRFFVFMNFGGRPTIFHFSMKLRRPALRPTLSDSLPCRFQSCELLLNTRLTSMRGGSRAGLFKLENDLT